MPQTEIIEETDAKRVVRSLENEVETVATFNKLANTVTVVVNGKEPVTIQLEAASSNQPVALARAATTGEKIRLVTMNIQLPTAVPRSGTSRCQKGTR